MLVKKITLITVWTICILIPIIGTAHFVMFPQRTHALLIAHSEFDEIGHNVFIEPGTSLSTKDSIDLSLIEAQKRMKSLWPRYDNDFKFIFCSTQEQYAKYAIASSSSPGLSHLTPIGAYLVINGSLGVDVDVISHEVCHAQLMNKVGWLTKEFDIPTWFDEGLALTVDYRFLNIDSLLQKKIDRGIAPRQLEALASPSSFYGGSSLDVSMAYLTAGTEVNRWFQSVGQKGLLELINEINEGEKFDTVYNQIEENANVQFLR